MKQTLLWVAVAIVVTLLITGGGVGAYFKSAEKQLKEQYDAKIAHSDSAIHDLQLANGILKRRLENDELYIDKKEAEVTALQKQNSILVANLVDTQHQIKEFTAGQAIKYFEDYAKITDNKMLVVGSDTNVVVTISSVKKVDSIFAEHKTYGLKIYTLDQIVMKQNGIITIQTDDITMYKQTITNKDSEISLSKSVCSDEKSKMQLDIDKFKTQRNHARIAFVGTAATVVGAILIKVFVLK